MVTKCKNYECAQKVDRLSGFLSCLLGVCGLKIYICFALLYTISFRNTVNIAWLFNVARTSKIFVHVSFLLQNYQHNPWLIHLTAKLLVNDPGAISLIEHNPFQNGTPPRLYNCINKIDGLYMYYCYVHLNITANISI